MLFDVYETPEWKLRNRIAFFTFSIELLGRNHDELTSLIEGIEHAKNPLQLLAVGDDWKLKEMMKEAAFRLHNYLASAKSLVDHARAMYQQLYEGTGRFTNFPDETKRRFDNDIDSSSRSWLA